MSEQMLLDASQRDFQELTAPLAKLMLDRNLKLATAESCTGGWIATCITALAGSSAWFDAGFVTYSNSAKKKMLGVPQAFFDPGNVGAVSEEVVRAMTSGAIARSDAQVAVAVSGVAGPDGGSADKPVGTVWIAWHWQTQQFARCYLFAGDRKAIRAATVETALQGLLDLVSENWQL